MKLPTLSLLALGLTLVQSWSKESWEIGEFERLYKEIQPSNEAWMEIPWLASLVPAQRKAAEVGKPMFVWAMDGHPMGCT